MQHIKSKVDGTKNGNKKVVFSADTVEGKRKRNIKIALYVLGGIAVVTAIYYGLEWYKKSKVNFENGGALSNANVNSMPEIPSANVPSLSNPI